MQSLPDLCKGFIYIYMQPLPDLCKGYVLCNFTQVEFYVNQNFPKFSSVQYFVSHTQKEFEHSECSMYFFKALWNMELTPSTYLCCPIWVLH